MIPDSPIDPLEYFALHALTVRGLEQVNVGFNNAVWLTDEYALRVSSLDQVDHALEASLALHALALGIRTAKPLFWAGDYSIWQRIVGSNATPPQPSHVWDALLDDLELWHANPPLPAPRLEEWVQQPFPHDRSPFAPGFWDADPQLLRSDFAMQLEPSEIARIEALFKPRRLEWLHFLHGDVFAANILVDDGQYAGLIDWGNAQWHAKEREYAWLEDEALEIALTRYDLDLELLYALRLELLLFVGSLGRATCGACSSAWDEKLASHRARTLASSITSSTKQKIDC